MTRITAATYDLRSVRRRLAVLTVGIVAAAAILISSAAARPSTAKARAAGAKPTIVLVHGAWADASSWNDVVKNLQDDGYPVVAPANPLRSLSGDSEYLASVLAQTPGPLVLVGHSYGGAVITNAAAGNPNVKALVYVDAFIPDVGENILNLAGAGSLIGQSIEFKSIPPGGPTDVDLYIKPDSFREAFAGDVPPKQAAIMAAEQRPLTLAAASGPTEAAAWKTIPSWALVGTEDNAITPEQQLFMAHRAGATIDEVDSSHLAMVSHPDEVTKLIETAADATT
jgi:pimeloyl-ACP methyl ester carboxylesterase